MKLPSSKLDELEKKWVDSLAFEPMATERKAYRQGIMDAVAYWKLFLKK